MIRSLLAMVLDVQQMKAGDIENTGGDFKPSTRQSSEGFVRDDVDTSDDTMGSQRKTSTAQNDMKTEQLKIICMGLMYASSIEPVKEEATALLKGFLSHIFHLIVSLRHHILRIDAFGCNISSSSAEAQTTNEEMSN